MRSKFANGSRGGGIWARLAIGRRPRTGRCPPAPAPPVGCKPVAIRREMRPPGGGSEHRQVAPAPLATDERRSRFVYLAALKACARLRRSRFVYGTLAGDRDRPGEGPL